MRFRAGLVVLASAGGMLGCAAPAAAVAGSFTVLCQPLAPNAPFDPILYPDQADQSHEHVFFGSSAPRDHPGARYEDLVARATPTTCARSGRATPHGGDKSAYWVPTLHALSPATSARPVAKMSSVAIYYFGPPKRPESFAPDFGDGLPADAVVPFPAGLKLVAGTDFGRPAAPGKAGVRSTAVQSFRCKDDKQRLTDPSGAYGCAGAPGEEIGLSVVVQFPECLRRDWKALRASATGDQPGTPRTSQRENNDPDVAGRDEAVTGKLVAYVDRRAKVGGHTGCFRQPYRLTMPRIQLRLTYLLEANQLYEFSPNPATNTAKPAGPQPWWTAHADFFDGWDRAELDVLMTRCIKAHKVCGNDSVPDDQQLNRGDVPALPPLPPIGPALGGSYEPAGASARSSPVGFCRLGLHDQRL